MPAASGGPLPRGSPASTMPGIEFFSRLGVFCRNQFLERDVCSRLCGTAAAAPAHDALVIRKRALGAVDTQARRARVIHPENHLAEIVAGRLHMLLPELNAYFAADATDFEAPQLLVYGEGDFYRPHRDRHFDADSPDYARRRQLSIVLFLNDQTTTPAVQGYCGGALTLYGLLDDPQWRQYGFHLSGEAGLLIAFRSTIIHAVTPVIHGVRYTYVNWAC